MKVGKLGRCDMRKYNEWRNINLGKMISIIRVGLIRLDDRSTKGDF